MLKKEFHESMKKGQNQPSKKPKEMPSKKAKSKAKAPVWVPKAVAGDPVDEPGRVSVPGESAGDPAQPSTFVNSDCTRCEKRTWRFASFHAWHQASYHAVAYRYAIFIQRCLLYSVDVLMGDGNGHLHFHSDKHRKDTQLKYGYGAGDTVNGTIPLITRAYCGATNNNTKWTNRVNHRLLFSTPFHRLQSNNELDCMVGVIFEYGTGSFAQHERRELQERIEDLFIQYDHVLYQKGGTIEQLLQSKRAVMSSDDFDFLRPYCETHNIFQGPTDYQVRLSERLKELDNQFLFLGEADKDWHFPILCTLRTRRPQDRQRGKEARDLRKEKRKEHMQQQEQLCFELTGQTFTKNQRRRGEHIAAMAAAKAKAGAGSSSSAAAPSAP